MPSSCRRPTRVRLKPQRGVSGVPFMNNIVSALEDKHNDNNNDNNRDKDNGKDELLQHARG